MRQWHAIALAAGRIDEATPMLREPYTRDLNWHTLTARLPRGMFPVDDAAFANMISLAMVFPFSYRLTRALHGGVADASSRPRRTSLVVADPRVSGRHAATSKPSIAWTNAARSISARAVTRFLWVESVKYGLSDSCSARTQRIPHRSDHFLGCQDFVRVGWPVDVHGCV